MVGFLLPITAPLDLRQYALSPAGRGYDLLHGYPRETLLETDAYTIGAPILLYEHLAHAGIRKGCEAAPSGDERGLGPAQWHTELTSLREYELYGCPES